MQPVATTHQSYRLVDGLRV